MIEVATNFVEYFKDKRETALETLVRITFGAFIGGLVLLTPACRSSDLTDRSGKRGLDLGRLRLSGRSPQRYCPASTPNAKARLQCLARASVTHFLTALCCADNDISL